MGFRQVVDLDAELILAVSKALLGTALLCTSPTLVMHYLPLPSWAMQVAAHPPPSHQVTSKHKLQVSQVTKNVMILSLQSLASSSVGAAAPLLLLPLTLRLPPLRSVLLHWSLQLLVPTHPICDR